MKNIDPEWIRWVADVDNETTALDRRIRLPWEIGIILSQPSTGQSFEYAYVIEDVDLIHADPVSLDISGFHERHPRGDRYRGPDPDVMYASAADVARAVADVFAEALMRAWQPVDWWGAVPDFDEQDIFKLLDGYGMIDESGAPPWHYHLGDVETFAAGRLGLRPPWDFDKILEHYGLAFAEGERHTALGDARMNKRLREAVIADADRHRRT